MKRLYGYILDMLFSWLMRREIEKHENKRMMKAAEDMADSILADLDIDCEAFCGLVKSGFTETEANELLK